MRFAILSDIHSNLQAWRAVAADLRQAGVDQVVCLGDIVGYGPNPAEVLEEVVQAADHVVLGNHDAVIGGRFDSDCFSDHARIAIEWTRRQLSGGAAEFFQQIPSVLRGPAFAVSHAEYEVPERFDYIFEPEESRPSFLSTQDAVMFFGHTHVPGVFRQDRETGEIDLVRPDRLQLNPAFRHLINVGSVGDPRDGDIRASYALFDAAAESVEFRKIPFDIAGYQSALRRSRLPTQPLFFQFLKPDLAPAHAIRRREFHADEAQVRQAAARTAQGTLTFDRNQLSTQIRAAGSGSFARQHASRQRRRQLAGIAGGVTLGCMLLLGILYGMHRRATPAKAGSPAGGSAFSPARLGDGLRGFLAFEEEAGASALSGLPGPPPAALSAEVARAPGVMGKGLALPAGKSGVGWDLGAGLPGPRGFALSWWAKSEEDRPLRLAWGPDLVLTASDDRADLVLHGKSSSWIASGTQPPRPFAWGRPSLAGASCSLFFLVKTEGEGTLYAEELGGQWIASFGLRDGSLVWKQGEREIRSPALPAAASAWRWLGVTLDREVGRLSFHLNGKPVSSSTLEPAPPGTNPDRAWIAPNAAATPALAGELDEAWIFLRALRPAEAAAIGVADAAAAWADDPLALAHHTFNGPAGPVVNNRLGRGFELACQPESLLSPSPQGKSARIGLGRPLEITEGFWDPFPTQPGLAGMPRPNGWRHWLLQADASVKPPVFTLFRDGEPLALSAGVRPDRLPVPGSLRWEGPGGLDEAAMYDRPLRPAEVRVLASRLPNWRVDGPIGGMTRPPWLKTEETAYASLAMRAGMAGARPEALLADLETLAARVRGTPLWLRAEAKAGELRQAGLTARDDTMKRLEAQADALAKKGEWAKAAALFEGYGGDHAEATAELRKQRAAALLAQDAQQARSRAEVAEALLVRTWPAAAEALLAADWPAMARLASESMAAVRGLEPARPPASDAALLESLANLPSAAAQGFKRLEGQMLDMDVFVSKGSETTLSPARAVWKYLDNDTHPPGWTAPGFSDQGWASGPGPLGYGDKRVATPVKFGEHAASKYITTRFRRAFTVAEGGAQPLLLRLMVDDAAAVYLNGREIHRFNLPEGPVEPGTKAVIRVDGENEEKYHEALLGRHPLQKGANLLAVEVHQASADSSDLLFDLELKAVAEPRLVRGRFQVEGVVSNQIQVVQIEADGRSRRLQLDPARMPLHSLAARLAPEDLPAHAALRAAAFAGAGKLDRAMAELQGRSHPFFPVLREAIVARPAAKP